MQRATIKDVGKRAGVHHSTVSLVLHDSPRISAATRKRVLKAAKELGYKADEGALALTARRAGLGPTLRIALLSSAMDIDAFNERTYNRLFLAGARTRAKALGFECELFCIGAEGRAFSDLTAILESRNFRGVIYLALDYHARHLPLDVSKFAMAKIDTQGFAPGIPSICNNQHQALLECYRNLRRLGYRRIGMAIGRDDEQNADNAFTAGLFLSQAEDPKPNPVPPLFFPYGARGPQATPLIRAWAKKHNVDAIMSNWSHIIPVTKNAGLKVPEQLACAGLGLTSANSIEAGIVQNHFQVGEHAVDVVATSWKADRLGVVANPTAMHVSGYWNDGASAPPKTSR